MTAERGRMEVNLWVSAEEIDDGKKNTSMKYENVL